MDGKDTDALAEGLAEARREIETLMDDWLNESMGLARALHEIAALTKQDRIRRWTERGLRSVRGVHRVLEKGLTRMRYRRGGRGLPDLKKQKKLRLEVE